MDEAITQELDLNESIGLAARRSEYVSALSEAGIASGVIVAFLTDNTRCRNFFAQSISDRAEKATQTRTEAQDRKGVMALVRRVQAAALQKYDANPSQRPHLADYYIGAGITISRANLAQYSAGIVQRLGTDTLPGITPEVIAALGAARAKWLATNDAQGAAGQAALAHRAEGKALLSSLRGTRLSIQYAMEGRFPHTDPANASARVAFSLPAKRPFRAPARR
ncbi:hypothetical protein [Armatimonas sp.]|uniref:hypothetical protein n=1 Tax=Armatimonas sp. TaxID=1872638 RepID=UPI00374D783D